MMCGWKGELRVGSAGRRWCEIMWAYSDDTLISKVVDSLSKEYNDWKKSLARQLNLAPLPTYAPNKHFRQNATGQPSRDGPPESRMQHRACTCASNT